VPREMTNFINPAPILQREARLSRLAGIRRRIRGKTSIRNPYLFTQFIMFSIIVRIVRRLYEFVEPFCFHCDIKMAIVIYFTLMRFVSELFALLSFCPSMLCLATLSKVFQLYMDWRVECQFPQHIC
jgi:hypothetical protein